MAVDDDAVEPSQGQCAASRGVGEVDKQGVLVQPQVGALGLDVEGVEEFRGHSSSSWDTSWTVAAYETPVSDRMWHVTATGATPAPIIKALLTVLASDDARNTDGDLISEKTVTEVTRPLADVGWQHTPMGRYLHWKPHDADVRLTFDAFAAQDPGDILNTWMIWAGQDMKRPEWAIRTSNYTRAGILSHLAGELAHGIGARQHRPRPVKLAAPSATTLPSRPPYEPPAPRLR
ncbi:DUF317 domain-containing protein [Streptomyces lavenduligriseus]|uniref:DUF317 domain-containing protein n=1 Tax=Streptomyces lavenduligriseus TaxID=67315 RepID=A0ABT0NVD9_9ACTN|nr:DUF317 domain-containing protein [Streptomyces lavenduligriseus]MCL3994762.1 DUF317 domain-containing protein [Streptomyces lavenduligriseus]